MEYTPLSQEQWERLVNFALTPEEMPTVYEFLALHPEEQARLTAARSANQTKSSIELSMLLNTLEDPGILTAEEIADYLDQNLDPVARERLESHLAVDADSREEVQLMRVYRDALNALPPIEIAPLPPQTLTDTVGMVALTAAGEVALPGSPKLTESVAQWLREMITNGIVTPIRAVQQTLAQMQQLAALTPTPALRGDRPIPLSPRSTAVRSQHPLLRWQGLPNVQEYTVLLARQRTDTESGTNTRPEIIWKQGVGDATEIPIPSEITLEQGSLYVWQVAATLNGERKSSPSVWFFLLSDAETRAVEAEERNQPGSSLLRIGIYEAYGLYEEAIQQAQSLADLNPGSLLVQTMFEKLLRQREHPGTV